MENLADMPVPEADMVTPDDSNNSIWIVGAIIFVCSLLIGGWWWYFQPDNTKSETETELSEQSGGEALPRCTLYYVNWCGHCKNLKPVWNELETLDKYNNKIKFEQVEGDENPETIQNEQIEGYPTIKLHKLNNETIEYQGDRTIKDLEQFIDNNI